jgi:hypothetical protein
VARARCPRAAPTTRRRWSSPFGGAGAGGGDGGAVAGAPRAPLPAEAVEAAAAVASARAANAAAAAAGVRACPACACEQPARAHHCRACDACVATYDHHCSLLGTCVGERNRARFLLFAWAHAALLGTAIGCLNVAFAFRAADADWRAANAWLIVLLALLWLLQAFTLPLAAFHAWLAATNTTTFETVRGAGRLWYLADNDDAKDCDLPFSRTCAGNAHLFWCALEAWDCGLPRAGCCGKPRADWQPYEWRAQKTNRNAALSESLWENQYFSCC